MDNLTHSLVGWAIAETGLKRRSRKGLAACVLAANMPDIDVFFGWAPWAPLATHRGFTHGLLGGVLLMPPLLAGLLWFLDRWQLQRSALAGSELPIHFGWLVALSYLGAITHPLLDLQNVYAVQLLSLASTRWLHTDGLFIVSPWLLAMLALGIWRARKRHCGAPAQAALMASVAFIALNMGISLMASKAAVHGFSHAKPDRIFASPEPLAFWKRDVIWRQAGTIHFSRYDPLVSPGSMLGHVTGMADNMNDPIVKTAARATGKVGVFLAFSQLPVATIVRQGCTATVTFGDARFSGPTLSRNFNVAVKVPLDRAACHQN